ncbi:hypothetical protein [Rhizobium rhizogenes]|uniref:hypothetical protein n=1 Tax=Rhizobium rhizogenes TaxID=359 RepID=UPI001574661C|nr:hypothetical protein [Rhizobium rhizogenes]NTF67915.1 hypothetical protein [Rhizobium rhizogenes]
MPNEPIAHLVWLQGRRAADDVEDYYEVARPGDKSVDGSDPFPVYASPSDAERHERSPKSNMLEIAIAAVLEADKEFRSNMPSEWDGDPLSGELDGLRRIFEAHLSAPPPPAAVQEPVAVKALEWVEASSGYWKAHSVGGRYSTYRVSYALGFDLRRDGESIGEYHLSLEAAKTAAQADYEYRIRSALSTSQSDPAPQTKLSGINTDLLKALKYVRRFLNPEDHDVSYVDDVIDKAEGRGLYAATATEGE